MSRSTAMTIGFFLIFISIQLFFVKSYMLSPKTTRFLAEHFSETSAAPSDSGSGTFTSWLGGSGNSGFSNPSTFGRSAIALPASSYGQKRVAPPKWLCWPFLFVGVVLFFHGVALRKTA